MSINIHIIEYKKNLEEKINNMNIDELAYYLHLNPSHISLLNEMNFDFCLELIDKLWEYEQFDKIEDCSIIHFLDHIDIVRLINLRKIKKAN